MNLQMLKVMYKIAVMADMDRIIKFASIKDADDTEWYLQMYMKIMKRIDIDIIDDEEKILKEIKIYTSSDGFENICRLADILKKYQKNQIPKKISSQFIKWCSTP